MADEQTTTIEVEEKIETTTVSNSLQEAAFGDNEPSQKTDAKVEATSQQVVSETTETKKEEIAILEPFYKKLGFEKEDDVINEITTLREKTAKTPDEIKFANEQSKQIHELLKEGKSKEVREFLQTQERIESLVSAEVNDDTAAEIIKLGLKLKHKDLTDKEIEHKYNKQYSLPKEPVKGELEDDDEFSEKHAAWKDRVDEIRMDKIIEAKTMKPDLEKAKTELVLPEIQKENQSQKKEPTPEELEGFKKDQETFLQSAQTSVSSFNGFNVQVKDKDVDYSVAYIPSQEEKTLVTVKLKQFAESGFDANSVFVDRWLNEDGKTMNIQQMTEDLSRILMGKNSDQKLATDSANKRLEAYLKEKKQIDVNETNTGSTFNPSNNQTEMDKVREAAFG